MTTRSVISFVLLPLLALLTHRLLFSGVEKPPSDHGKGSMFDQIASRYDIINRVLAVGMDMGWRRTMVAEIKASVNPDHSVRILDVSTGTADVALLLARKIPNASVLGIDPSPNMLDVGRTKVQKHQLDSQVDLQLSDARDLMTFSESSFDAATMSFGIRNVPERGVALCQIHRLLKDTSRFCILEFSEPDDSFGLMGIGARFFIRNVIPVLGGILSGAPREYWHLQNSIKDFPSPRDFSKEIQSLQCDSGWFSVEEIQQLNFGSVQIYVITAKKKPKVEEGS